jgi:glycosyltransferase involved in cell wall biosynthesis
MMPNPLKFSVLMSTYHGDTPSAVGAALDSVFDQTLIPDEVVLILDGQIDVENQNVIERCRLKYSNLLKIFQLNENLGLGPALNYGLSKCQNEWVARMDSDDIAVRDRFENQVQYILQNPTIDVLGGHAEEFYNVPGDLKRVNKSPVQGEIFAYSRLRNPVVHPTVFYRKSAVIAVNSYSNIPYFEDYYLWLQMLHAGYKIANLNKILIYFRNSSTISRRHGLTYAKYELNFLQKAHSHNLLSTFYLLSNILLRIPVRIMPREILAFLYGKVLRK